MAKACLTRDIFTALSCLISGAKRRVLVKPLCLYMLVTWMTCNTSNTTNNYHALDNIPQLHDIQLFSDVHEVLPRCYRKCVIAETSQEKVMPVALARMACSW